MKSLALSGGFGPLPKLSSLPKDIGDQSFKKQAILGTQLSHYSYHYTIRILWNTGEQKLH